MDVNSLNLCGQHSFAETASCITFFGTLQRMFSFFATSTHRWDVLIEHTGMSLKMPFTTRWSTHHAAFKLVKDKINESMAKLMLYMSLVKMCHKRYSTWTLTFCMWFHVYLLQLIDSKKLILHSSTCRLNT